MYLSLTKISLMSFLKNKAHAKKVGHTSEFLFWHLLMNLKNNYLFKKLMKQTNKKYKFNIYNVQFIKTPGDIFILQLCTINLDEISYSSWVIECNGLRLVILYHFSLLSPLLPLLTVWKINFFLKNEKTLGDAIILHMLTKNHNHMMYGS